MVAYPMRMDSLFDDGAMAPCPDRFNMAAHVLAAGAADPDKIALAVLGLTGAERWSYARLTQAVLGTATGLLQAGIAPGQIVLMRLGNTVDFPIVYLGAIAAGIVPVPTSSQLVMREVAKIVRDLSPAAILRDGQIACPQDGPPVFDAERIRAWHDLPPATYDLGDPDRLAYIVYTSGTSGTPRAVGHAHRAIWARGMMFDGWYGLRQSDRLLHAGAFNWTYTLGTGLMDPWTRGATALIPKAGTEPGQLPLLLRRNDATLFAAAPGVYRQMLKTAPPALPRLRHGLSAGEKLPDALRAAWHEATGTPLYEAFGMSEISTFVSSSPTRGEAAPGCLGWPQEGRRIALLDDQGAVVPRGTPGTIAVHRTDPGLMLGYIGAPEATQARMAADWFLTGDRAIMRADGQLAYQGRGDDMMNAGGFRVSPLEVEAALADLPGITELAVTDVEIRSDTRIIAAFYTGPKPLDEDALKAQAAERLARYKQPRLFVHVPALPRNPNGKLTRSALRAFVATRPG